MKKPLPSLPSPPLPPSKVMPDPVLAELPAAACPSKVMANPVLPGLPAAACPQWLVPQKAAEPPVPEQLQPESLRCRSLVRRAKVSCLLKEPMP
jgi:hypothetical protein